MKTEKQIKEKRNQIINRISYLQNIETLSDSKNQRLRQKLIAELHTIDFCLGKSNIDSDDWFKELEKENK